MKEQSPTLRWQVETKGAGSWAKPPARGAGSHGANMQQELYRILKGVCKEERTPGKNQVLKSETKVSSGKNCQ